MNEPTEKKAPRKKKAADVDIREAIAVRAYFLAQASGFEPGREMDFWLQAESEAATASKPTRTRKKS